ncbi:MULTISPECIES: M23 family metallopeptidase [Phenylobacterium]|uniref:M23ase beta-sheet core domain-containing protein n=1 Tax=Phenylobacterium koreense TaxID=266125 RepID=A0ABV2EE38_9CAUL
MRLVPLVLAGLAVACSPSGGSSAQAPKTAAATASPAAGPRLSLPIACTVGSTCEVQNYVDLDPGPGVKDYRCSSNTYEAHSGVDIRLLDMKAQAAGVDVLAAAAGTVARLRDGVPDISIRERGKAAVNGQECGNGVVISHGDGWETQYCHLAQGSVKVKVGDQVAAGAPIAKVGLSGQTEYPHVHLTVRKDGVMIDPFAPNLAPGSCDGAAAGGGMWTPQAAKAMAYKAGTVLNAGFAAAPVSMASIEAGALPRPTTTSPLIAYVRAINLRGGDVQELTLTGPDGRVLATSAQPPLDRAKAQYMFFVGKKAPAAGAWARGRYTGAYVVRRDGQTVVSRTFAIEL